MGGHGRPSAGVGGERLFVGGRGREGRTRKDRAAARLQRHAVRGTGGALRGWAAGSAETIAASAHPRSAAEDTAFPGPQKAESTESPDRKRRLNSGINLHFCGSGGGS